MKWRTQQTITDDSNVAIDCKETWWTTEQRTNYAIKLFWNNDTNDDARHPSNISHSTYTVSTSYPLNSKLKHTVAIEGNQSKLWLNMQSKNVSYNLLCARKLLPEATISCSIVCASLLVLSWNCFLTIVFQALTQAIHSHQIQCRCGTYDAWRIYVIVMSFVTSSDDAI